MKIFFELPEDRGVDPFSNANIFLLNQLIAKIKTVKSSFRPPLNSVLGYIIRDFLRLKIGLTLVLKAVLSENLLYTLISTSG
jgi:hypothetical protein